MIFKLPGLPSTENKSFDPVAMAMTIQGVFVSILPNMSRFKVFGFASCFYVW